MTRLKRLRDLINLEATSCVRVVDYWNGLGPTAPIEYRTHLMRSASGVFTGTCTHSERERIVGRACIALDHKQTASLLRNLGRAAVRAGTYEPFHGWTEDLPRITIELLDGHSKTRARLHTESQGTYHAPWSITLGEASYIGPSDDIGRALRLLRKRVNAALKVAGPLTRGSAGYAAILTTPYSRAAARERHCEFRRDRVPGDPQTTRWKRRSRFRQCCWRRANGYPAGIGRRFGRWVPVGSRIDDDSSVRMEANFISAAALAAARRRLAVRDDLSRLGYVPLFSNLLSSTALAFNLCGDLEEDSVLARRAVSGWWPESSSGPVSVRFAHSPGSKDPTFLNSRRVFSVAFEIDCGSAREVIAISMKYHQHAQVAAVPKAARMRRYLEISELSGVFRKGWQDAVLGTALQGLWLDHLLVLSMLQHPSRRWRQGRLVLVYPRRNASFHAAGAAYRALLTDGSTFEARTLESLVDDHPAEATAGAVRERYLLDA